LTATKVLTARKRPGGRSSLVRRAVFDATLALLAQRGLASLSIEEIAARAGVNKTTIYRNWPTRTDLILAAAADRSEHEIVVRQTDDVEKDLIAFLSSVAANITSPLGRALLIATLEPAGSPPASQAKDTFWKQRFEAADGLIRSLLGQRSSKEDVDAFIERLIGPIYLRVLVTGKDVDASYIRRLVRSAVRDQAGTPRGYA
jgi:AcrR family transcriptional regulator